MDYIWWTQGYNWDREFDKAKWFGALPFRCALFYVEFQLQRLQIFPKTPKNYLNVSKNVQTRNDEHDEVFVDILNRELFNGGC